MRSDRIASSCALQRVRELLSSAFRLIAYVGVCSLELRRRRKCETHGEGLNVSSKVEVVGYDARFATTMDRYHERGSVSFDN